MSNEELRSASEHLRTASTRASADASERLSDHADQLEQLAAADRGPDHGRLARHEHVLTEVAEEEGGEVAEAIETALRDIRAYRETVEGV